MSAVPQKKLCWNCDGNVSRDLDSCPYCGVCVHSIDIEGNTWSAPYQAAAHHSESEEVPSPLYKIHSPLKEDRIEALNDDPSDSFGEEESLFHQVKKDVLPILLLMSGSIFFLFGLVLLLFAENGALTLQWNGNHWPYFLFSALPCCVLGWRYLSQIDGDGE